MKIATGARRHGEKRRRIHRYTQMNTDNNEEAKR